MFASVDADWVAGKVMPAPLADAVAAPTPMVVAKEGVVSVANVADVVGKVNVVVPATAGADRVTDPDVSPAITTALIFFPYKTSQRWPLVTVTLIPGETVVGPTERALYPLATV